MSEWLHAVLSPHVEEIVVLGVPPCKTGPKSDARDAFGLANQLRLGDVELAERCVHGGCKAGSRGRAFSAVTSGNWYRVQSALRASRSVDVIGGMAGKLEALLGEVVRHGWEAHILDGRRRGHLAATLAGRPVGTLVAKAV